MLCLRWRRLFSRSYSHATCHSDRRQYLGCLIDGWVYTGQRYGPDHKASYYPAYNEDEKATVHVYVWVDDNTSISFNIIDPKEKISPFTVILKRWIMTRLSIPTPYSKMVINKKKDWKTALSILPALI